jgi:signal transduction histidine kinase
MSIGARFTQRRTMALLLLDVVLACALTAGALSDVSALGSHAPSALAVLLSVACTTTVAWRRVAPVAAVLISATALWVYELATGDLRLTFLPYAVAFAYYMLGRRVPRRDRRSVLTLLGGYGLVSLGITAAAAGGSWLPMTVYTWVLFAVVPCGLGAVIARIAEMTQELAADIDRLKDAQDARAAQAVGDERNRVARELHDVIAHCVSVMVIQASAARLIAADDAASARAALRVVETCGRDAMADLRRIMGVLRRGEDTRDGLVPGLAQLGALVERTQTAGVPTRLRIAGRPEGLAPGVDLVAYRVVQEALTNVVKHAPGSEAAVDVQVTTDALDVQITNASNGKVPARLLPESGHGLTGMRERVTIYGGTLSTGPEPGGGYAVRARIPLEQGATILDEALLDGPVIKTSAEPATRSKQWLDPTLAGCWLAVLETEALTSSHTRGTLALNVLVVGAMALAGLWRRRAPLLFVLIVGLLAIVLSNGLTSDSYASITGLYSVLIPSYALGRWAKRSHAAIGLVGWACGATAMGVVQDSPLSGIAGPLLAAGASFAAGWAARAQRDLSARLKVTASRLATERADRTRLAIVGERTRIARELHTVVAQAVTSMVIQAEAAQHLLDTNPPLAVIAAAAVEDTGRGALIQLRNVLGVLRSTGTDRSLRPLPGIDQIHALIERAREAGGQIEFSIDGEPDTVVATVDLVTYRIIEEALSLPAGRATTTQITVALRFTEENLELELSSSGPASRSWPTPAMRERVALCAGQLSVAATADARASRMIIQLPRGLQAAFA